MAVSKVIYGNTTVIDITDSTVTASKLKSGEYAYGADGTKITGTLVVPEELDDLSDVVITSPETAQELYYDGTEWINYGAKILLTFDDDFRGQTITLTKGQTTITKTAPLSGNTMNLYVNDTGLWTISSTISGDTYETEVDVTTFGTSFDAVLSSVPPIPEGATVTPTDDIQTWLACANIIDKAYTTLAEVLADEVTYETLLRDSNACDYMARSTSWASNPPLVPTMTSATTPSGTVSAKSRYDSNTESWKAFDGNTTTYWQSSQFGISALPQWIRYEFPTATPIGLVKLKNTNTNYQIGTFKIQGSNNGTDFTDLTEVMTNTDTSLGGESKYSVNNQQAYKYVQLSVESGYSTYTYASIAELQYYAKETCICDNETAMRYLGKYDYACEKLLGNATWANAIVSSSYFEYVLNVKVPVMTSNTTPSGVCSASSVYHATNFPAWKAFNSSETYGWVPSSTGSAWIRYEFTSEVYLECVYLKSLGMSISNGKIQGSNDATAWSDLGDVTLSASEIKTISLTQKGNYKYYQVVGTMDTGGQGLKLQFYGRKSLRDTYVPLVPTMTSNTTPSGTASANVIYGTGYEAWRAFNVSETNGWIARNTTLYATGDWLEYDFDTDVTIDKVSVGWKNSTSANSGITYKIQEYNGSTWEDVSTEQSISFVANTIVWNDILLTNSSNRKHRLYITSVVGSNANGYGFKMQFYAKLDTTIVHSAPLDTIYYMENGSPVVVCTTNSDGVGELDLDDLEDATYTFYSSVAKDPSNLSNDFSKTIRITKSEFGGTTEMYLMPDTVKTLYWWGYMSDDCEELSTANGWTVGYSGMSFQNVTFQTNYVDCSPASAKVSLFGSKTKKPASITHCIALGITVVSGNYGVFRGDADKTIDATGLESTVFDSNSMKKYDLTRTVESYINAGSSAGRKANVYALWYE